MSFTDSWGFMTACGSKRSIHTNYIIKGIYIQINEAWVHRMCQHNVHIATKSSKPFKHYQSIWAYVIFFITLLAA